VGGQEQEDASRLGPEGAEWMTASSLVLSNLVMSSLVVSNFVRSRLVRATLVRATLAARELPQTEEQPLAVQRKLNLTEAQLPEEASASRWPGAGAVLEAPTWAEELPEIWARPAQMEH
jgi:hypothetical protein